MKTLTINFGPSYPIYIGNNLLNTNLLVDFCRQLNKRFVLITDSHIADTLGKKVLDVLQQHLAIELLVFPAGEMHKTRETKQILEDTLLDKQYARDTCLIALGGGVVSDLVGFTAATYCRGIPTIYIPTTLLAMVDASIGGKTGVNTPHGKNLIGCFYQPSAVFMDTSTLNTLPKNEWHNGMAEIIKHCVIADTPNFIKLKQNTEKILQHDYHFLTEIIYASCLVKKNIVEQDEKDLSIRQLLNFGHTIGHAIETLENYKISHGEAVAIGMLVESYLSVKCGFLHETALTAMNELLIAYHLPLQTNAFQDKDTLQKLLFIDKKAVGKIPHFVLLDEIGKPHIHNNHYTSPVDPALLNQALDWAKQRFKAPPI